jgi:small-conductance mechanosensitive channel
MSNSEKLFDRIGRIFRRSPRGNGDLDMPRASSDNPVEAKPGVVVETRTLLRPWARNRNTAAIAQLQDGFRTLTELMSVIKQNLESQSRRQDELLAHLSALPKVLDTIPESNRLHGETLKAIHQQLQHQADQQGTLGEILEKLSDAEGDQKDLLEGLRTRVETLNQQDKSMADSLGNVGNAMESVTRQSVASTEVLGQLRDNLKARDADLEKVLRRQGTRFTTMLAFAIVLSFLALAAVAGMAWMMMNRH